MLRVPDDLAATFPHVAGEGVDVVQYAARSRVVAEPVLVTRPTLVLVAAGVKQLHPPTGAARIAPAPSLIALRSGTHVMSEFHGDDGAYRSWILSFERDMLRRAIGQPGPLPDGPRVEVGPASPAVVEAVEALPGFLTPDVAAVEQAFRVRQVLMGAMLHGPTRQLLYRELVDWGHTAEERLATVLSAHGLSPLQVPQLAALCGMSLSSFKRVFRRVYDETPGRWLSRTRLTHARAVLRGGDASVVEVAASAGYRDASSFIRAFRREFGITPGSVRGG